MRKFGAVLGLSRVVIPGACPRLTGMTGNLLLAILLTIALVACGDDSGTSANNDKDTELAEVSSSSKAVSSSSVKGSSSSVILSSSEGFSQSKSSSSVTPASSSSKKVESSSSEYVPYDHSTCLAWNWNIDKEVYKQFTDPRNGRSYYYYTAVSSKTGRKVTVMAENLNIGEMVLGENDQNDDTKIERYCYNNDTTNCDKYGGLYQWAEMMQLPSRCNTESCSDWIERDHQGICPEGWRLFTWDDFEIIRDYNDQYGDGVKGLRSQCFQGKNTSGFSLIGGGVRFENGTFKNLTDAVFWTYPQEQEYDVTLFAYSAFVSVNSDDNTGTQKNRRGEKSNGYSVRCVKIE
ncbi:FISUMP domain-containing protein [uncultured Fibrobacter sp.]|uniref:FISUMP domain-containing protein n=1 Tax=uncultured Fibrobacter sp. TaxID=261512 RepID=UPI0025F8B0B1|nr:FISUMP domain-containing protein [uncultured Fibrobacter sp.]